MIEVEEILINIGVIEGLNGQREYYIIPQNDYVDNTVWQGVNASEYETLGSELDKSKAPAYILDVDDNYIPFEDVAQLLVDKYFEDRIEILEASVGSQVKLRIDRLNMTQSEYMARMILLIEELSNYDWYIIGASTLYIQTDFNGTTWIKAPMQTLRSDFVTITPEVIYSGWYEIDVYGMSYIPSMVQSTYDGLVLSELFNGFVLDFE